MKKLILLITFCLFHLYSFSQKTIWAKKIGGQKTEYIADIKVGRSDNVYSIGTYIGTVDFDPGIDSFKLFNSSLSDSYQDMFISKLNNQGDFVWATHLDGNYSESGTSIELDKQENIYAGGSFFSTVDFDPLGTARLSAIGGSDAFILKLDSSGIFLWVRRFGGTAYESVNSVTTDEQGNVYAIGWFSNTVDFDPGPGTFTLSSSTETTFILKLDSSGNFIWARKLDGTSDGRSIKLDKSGNIYCSGFYSSTVDFDPSTTGTYNLTSNGNQDIYYLKLTNSGNFIWAKTIGGTDNESAFSLYVNDSGWVYSAGYFTGNVDFNPGTSTYNLTSVNNSADAFILKLDSLGSFLWARKFGANNNDVVYSLVVDTVGNVYTTGAFSLNVDFDPGTGVKDIYSHGLTDAFISSLDANGNFLSAITFGESGYDAGYCIARNRLGNLYSGGVFSNTVNFNQFGIPINLTSAGTSDIYISKYCPPFIVSGTISGPTNLCSGSTATYSINSIQGATTYIWIVPLGATILSGQGTTSITVLFGQDTGGIGVTSYNFCGSFSSIFLNIHLSPQILGGAYPPEICLGSSSNLSAIGATTYSWSPATGLSSTTGNNITATPTTTTVYTVTGTIGSCSYSKAIKVTVTAPQPIIVSPSSPGICLGGSVVLIASGADTYSWYPTNGLDTTKGSTVTARPLTTTTYTITGYLKGCIATKTVTVIVSQQPPTINIIPANPTICAKGSVYIMASGATNYNWFPSTGLNTDTGSTIIASPRTTTTYTVTGITNGCSNSMSVTVIVKPAPLVTTTLTGTTLKADLSGATYQWLKCPNYSVITGETNQSYTPNKSGIYAVLITSNNCFDTSTCMQVNMLGINENNENFDVVIYPNPNNGSFVLESKQNGSYLLVNELGQTITKLEFNASNKNKIQINNLSRGVYLIVGAVENRTRSRKIIVVK